MINIFRLIIILGAFASTQAFIQPFTTRRCALTKLVSTPHERIELSLSAAGISPPNPNTAEEGDRILHHDGVVAVGACLLALLVATAKPLPLETGYLLQPPAPLESTTHMISNRFLDYENHRPAVNPTLKAPDKKQLKATRENMKVFYRRGGGEDTREPGVEYV